MLNTTLLAILIVIITVIFVKYLENQNSSWLKILLQWVPPILFAYILPALISFIIDINFQNVVIHRWSKEIIIPVAIITVMSSMSLKQLRIIGIKPIILFVLGSFTIAILPVILIGMITQFFPNQAAGFMAGDMWKGLIPLVGSWIGGSTSQLVLKEYVGTAENLFLSIIILDNILVNIWTILMFQLIRQSGRLDRVLNIEAAPEIVSELKHQSKVKKNGFFYCIDCCPNFIVDHLFKFIIFGCYCSLILFRNSVGQFISFLAPPVVFKFRIICNHYSYGDSGFKTELWEF